MPTSSVVKSLLLIAIAGLVACSQKGEAPASSGRVEHTAVTQTPATYVGAASCAECHAEEWRAWQGSHHDLALQQASAETVLARVPSEFGATAVSRLDDQIMMQPDAETPASAIRYTFGVEPLQQYVIEAGKGHLQVLPMPWDTRRAEEGGQRWYRLYSDEYPAGDPMHWGGRASSWNGMCADCHSTGVEKNYDPATRSYRTTFKEEDVACEACHGPGSLHATAAASGQALGGLLADISSQQGQINTCAQCHSRRAQLKEGFKADESFFDFYQPSLLRDGLYHADGQILDEVYVYGSFLQSRMHLQGVTCSNCHEPHSTKLKFEGNAVCTQCHNTSGRPEFSTLKAALYDDPAHHFHADASEGSACVSCHMPAETYMGVDVRNDHSFRLPRPDLSEKIGVPNTCNGCHTDRSANWASTVIEERYGARPDHFGVVFAAAALGNANAEAPLAAIAADQNTPIMVRATAVSLLANIDNGETLAKLDTLYQAKDGHPLLQLGATRGASGLTPQRQWQLLSPLLADEHLAVRAAAFSALLGVANDPELGPRLRAFLPDYLDSQSVSLDFPETQVNLANVHAAFGDVAAAEAALQEALNLQSSFIPGLLNLAELYRVSQRDEAAGELLLIAMATAPEAASPVFSYALWLTRQQRPADALEYYQRAVELEPQSLRYGYTLAIALNDNGEGAAAVDRLANMLERWPGNRDLLLAMVLMLRDQGRNAEALQGIDQLLEITPGDESLRQLREQIGNSG